MKSIFHFYHIKSNYSNGVEYRVRIHCDTLNKTVKLNEIPITSGIIRGGQQSPLCFAAFINDLPDYITFGNVADDTKRYMQINDENDAMKLQQSIDEYMAWMTANNWK